MVDPFDPERVAFLARTDEAIRQNPQTVAITLLNNTPGAFRGRGSTFVFEAVGDIEVTGSVELSTEPGVMGRIGPKFPRSASFRVRVHDNPRRSPAATGLFIPPTAIAQHSLLQNLVGTLVYVDARASPPERITWTLENVKGLDDNSAKNAFDVEISIREILGGDFGEFIDPSDLSIEKGLVPVEINTPVVLGVEGSAAINLAFIDFVNPDFDRRNPFPLTESERARNAIVDSSQQDAIVRRTTASGDELYSNIGDPYGPNERAVATRTSSRIANKMLKGVETMVNGSDNHVLGFGAMLPEIPGCTTATLKATALGEDFVFTIDATLNVQTISVKWRDTVRVITPETMQIFKGVANDPYPHRTGTGFFRTDIDYPDTMDLAMGFFSDAGSQEEVPFISTNLPRFGLVFLFMGELPA